MNQIKVILEVLKSKDDFGAWFVSLDGSTVYDVSEDGGGGHHAGYLWVTANEERLALFGLTVEEGQIIRQYFLGEEDNWTPMHPYEESEYYMGTAAGVQRPNYAEFLTIIKKIYNKFIRIVFIEDAAAGPFPLTRSVFVTVKDADKQSHHKMVEFLMTQNLPAYEVWVDTYDDKAIWSGIPRNEMFKTDSFSDIIKPRLKRYRNYYFNESKKVST